jgi:putative transposase
MMSDNGSGMTSAEFISGMNRLAIEHNLTQLYSPHQNGKIESFWTPLEGRLIKMLAHVKPLTLDALNKYTQAWVEEDYNNKRHSETGEKPLTRYLDGKDVLRPAPNYEIMVKAFRTPTKRIIRKSDHTITVDTIRFEVPRHLHHFQEITVAYAQWDLSSVTVLDPETHQGVCEIFPADLNKNANGLRAPLSANPSTAPEQSQDEPSEHLPPTLARCLRDFATKNPLAGYIPYERNK